MSKDHKDEIIESLRAEVKDLKAQLSSELRDMNTTYFSSSHALIPQEEHIQMPTHGMSARHVKERIVAMEQLDFKPGLNTSSYVNVVTEPEERDVALLGLTTNIADASVYPASMKMHDMVVNMLAQLWNCPEPKNRKDFSGAGTVGSTEACLLAGLALKFRWRKWYAKKFNKTEEEVEGIRPNLVISTCYQAAWEKFFRYFDVDPKFVVPTAKNKLRIDAKDLVAQCDDKTIAVVCILGSHYNGAYDPVWEVSPLLTALNKEKDYQIGIHVDAASGGFIAPFQEGLPAWDFRLENVLSISASGHKFGESICGTGWVIFRHRENLAEHIAVSVTYLGGHCDSMTLNFSRPASGVYVQYYKFLRLGKVGYANKVRNQMAVSAYIRNYLMTTVDKATGKNLFLSMDCGDTHCLPVVAARLNPEITLNKFTDIDLQHALYESHWYVSGYSLAFENFKKGGQMEPLASDLGTRSTMFRVVVKSNLTYNLAQDLVEHIKGVVKILSHVMGYADFKRGIRQFKSAVHLLERMRKDGSFDDLERLDDGEEGEHKIRIGHTVC